MDYEKGILYVVGSQIGKVLKVDSNTLRQSKGRFARICVEVDLNKPLLPAILINGVEKKIVYEGLHMIWFACGRYGHETEKCFHKSQNLNQNSTNKSSGSSSHSNNVVPGMDDVTESCDKPFGEWMLAPRRRRFNKVSTAVGGNGNGRFSKATGSNGLVGSGNGSRFSALSTDVETIPEVDKAVDIKRKPLSDVSNFHKAHLSSFNNKVIASSRKRVDGMAGLGKYSGAGRNNWSPLKSQGDGDSHLEKNSSAARSAICALEDQMVEIVPA